MAEEGKKKVLIIEDDPFLLKIYQEKFTGEGFDVVTAEDGVEGLRLAKEGNLNIVILDILIPKLSGVDLLLKLREDDKGKTLPVIALTNLTQPEEQQKVMTLGVKEYLVKSDYTPNQVVEKIRKYI
ncbi:hypothetical protein A3A76_04295 [Candidatus Woesebacteria bacterium RIFCSPLOWO2_01_FULL_39_23]|uniref:Response regulatory domain-containing protein n=1 Tax=Candidatus Woesebacteria bacterium RIFCSPHIGHO2_01_FULL_40_22 TaxID=1802499 RepID=A0A1F7YF74_9BACT|nr:MAG: hypothetical protein A2141_01860 [Candidatus Woesebacteria bacterium RBG_16_40_11]OGM25973.1 MAG: hypothetical protein A2628_00295 [Candidatus Woesebacteria bacterium RIFCSPHIGHO2_01_FULL_40_22]OGM38085.1 MAG: hypothetical protein A3E41_03380 [Candidatus Woesebacteria bacterium RIFCSPHIGHO2_12_FULL_38_9]OGM61822.1 MAG: hypothetical protein A3A76_04295 [Candidatus Woesebacteria bacterium RIFCSPLOWO2_01_FULL_39_23]